jgi:uncharacterized repeat protein (TIGR03987 family)
MPASAIYMFIALAFYTYAVFSGRKEGLKGKHLLAFGVGLLMDSKGTYDMSVLASATGGVGPLHLYTGIGGLAGMAFHFLLALAATVIGKADQANHAFHRVSLFIYTLWMLAFLSGGVIGVMTAVEGS